MSDRMGLKYLFDQLNLNVRQATWLATINEFDFETRYIRGKENMVGDALSKRVHVHHLVAMSSSGTYLQDRILQTCQQDVRYMDIVHRLQQGNITGKCASRGTCAGAGAQGMDYCLTVGGLVRF